MDTDFNISFGRAELKDLYSGWVVSALVNSRNTVGAVVFRRPDRLGRGHEFRLWLAECDRAAYGKESLNRLFRQAVQQALSSNYFIQQPDGELARFDPQVDEWQGRWERPDHQDVLHP